MNKQTNIDFYVIIERKGEWLKVQKLIKHTSAEVGFMTNHETPMYIFDLTQKVLRKKLKTFNGVESGFSFRNYSCGGWCSLWKGESMTSSHYA